MKYRPGLEPNPLPYGVFKSSTVPRPIGWLSSVDEQGSENIAPYSQWQNLTFDTPKVMFSANRYPDGRRKDTVVNAESTGWFVYNMATYALRDAVNASAMALPPGESEFNHMDVTKVLAESHPIPMVAESPIKFECRYHSTTTIPGRSHVGTIDVVFAEVAVIHVDDEVITDDGKIDILSIAPIARMGYFDYTVVKELFEMKVPGSDRNAQLGLEGQAG